MPSAVEVKANTSVPAVLNVEGLLAPIPGEKPSGESLQYTGLFDEIREARRSEDNLDQGEWKREAKLADWDRVLELASDALATKTKDLQVCAWLDESAVKVHGFAGLRDGLKVMAGLHQNFWDNLYPEVEDGDLEGRANAISFMDRQVAQAAREVPLTKHPSGINLSLIQWEASKQFDIPENLEALDPSVQEQADQTRARATAEGKLTTEDWRKAKGATKRAFYEEIWTLLSECVTEFENLDRVMDERFQRETPGLGSLKKALADIQSALEKIVKEKRILEPDPVGDVGLTNADGTGGNGNEPNIVVSEGGMGISSGPIRSRTEALRRLSEVADYFRRTEPHSPVSYLVQRAIKWGDMPLESWLGDVIKSPEVLDQLRDILGIGVDK
jgi:type VI secretion system protein ImpA